MDALEGDSSTLRPSVVVRGLTIVCLLLGPAKTAAVRQPKNCRIHPDWNSNGSPSPGSILHDNDVVTFGEEIVHADVCFATLIACLCGKLSVAISTYMCL